MRNFLSGVFGGRKEKVGARPGLRPGARFCRQQLILSKRVTEADWGYVRRWRVA